MAIRDDDPDFTAKPASDIAIDNNRGLRARSPLATSWPWMSTSLVSSPALLTCALTTPMISNADKFTIRFRSRVGCSRQLQPIRFFKWASTGHSCRLLTPRKNSKESALAPLRRKRGKQDLRLSPRDAAALQNDGRIPGIHIRRWAYG